MIRGDIAEGNICEESNFVFIRVLSWPKNTP